MNPIRLYTTLCLLFILSCSPVSLFPADWEVISKTEQLLTFRVISFINGQFVGAGDDGLLRTSSNGKTWTARSHSKAHTIYNIKYYNGLYIAVGRDELIETSPDLVNWTVRNPSFPQVNSLIGLADNGSDTIVAAGINGAVWVSSDGAAWSRINPGYKFEIWELVYAKGKFVGVGSSGHVATSSNGYTWKTQKLPTPENFYGLVYGGGLFVLVGANGACFTSTNGTSWTKRDVGTYAHLMEVTYSGSHFVAVGDGNEGCSRIVVSGNGIDWVKDKIDKSYGNITRTFTAVGSGNGYVVAGGARYRIIRNTFGGVGDGKGCPSKKPPPPPSGPTIIITTPNGGETWTGGVTYALKWTTSGTIDTVDIEYTLDNGKTYNVLVSGTENDGQYAWTPPEINSSGCRFWIRGAGPEGSDIDFSDGYFTIKTSTPPPPGAITVTQPNGGETWSPGATQKVTWTSTGNIPAVRIVYSVNGGSTWSTIVSSTTNDGSYSWVLPAVESTACRIKIIDTANSSVYDVSNSHFSILPTGKPEMQVDKKQLNFGHVYGGSGTAAQYITVSNTGGGSLNWSAAADVSWLNISPGYGANSTVVEVSITPTGLSAGHYNGSITFTAPGADNSPQTAAVSLKIIQGRDDRQPFGLFSTPLDGKTGVTGSIPVTGWVLDDIGVRDVKIYRQVGTGLAHIGDAVFVEGARPDVQQSYPDYPNNSKAGWGYMLLTNFLDDGPLVLKAIATDTSGQKVTLGAKTITLDNVHAVKPFGAIDTPKEGGPASGGRFVNWGWVLTPQPNSIPINGSTITVWVDGVSLGHPTYNIYRSDIAGLFPTYANSGGAIGYFYIDTTNYANGVHTIQWSAKDNAGNQDGIGSRYFTIQNTGATSSASQTSHMAADPRVIPKIKFKRGIDDCPQHHASAEPVHAVIGLQKQTPPRPVYPDETGALTIDIDELELLELHLLPQSLVNSNWTTFPTSTLPPGSTLDPERGIFHWQPGAGFFGQYRFDFIIKNQHNQLIHRNILIHIRPH
jgi:hypothetical protein